MRTWIPILALGLLAILAMAVPAQAQQTSVTYHLYHFEGGIWVEYWPNATLPVRRRPTGHQPLALHVRALQRRLLQRAVRAQRILQLGQRSLLGLRDATDQPTDLDGHQVGPFAPDNNWRLRFRTLVTAARVAQGTCGHFPSTSPGSAEPCRAPRTTTRSPPLVRRRSDHPRRPRSGGVHDLGSRSRRSTSRPRFVAVRTRRTRRRRAASFFLGSPRSPFTGNPPVASLTTLPACAPSA